MPKVRRSTGAVLMMALVLSLGVECVVGADMTAAQMACCKGIKHDCQGPEVTAECCQTEPAEQQQLVGKPVQPPAPPLAEVVTAIPALAPPPDPYSSVFHVDTIRLTAASPPKYVLLASFLI